MIKIAMLGCDSSHTEAYSQLLHTQSSPFWGKAKINWLWGENHQQAQDKAKKNDIPYVCESVQQAVSEADLVLVSGRYGDSHIEPAKIAITKGKPTYIDKPLTNDYSQAKDIAKIAKESGSSVM